MTWATGTGGDLVEDITDGDGVTWRYHKFTTVGSGTFTATSAGDVEYLIVAGGGAGGPNRGGGGGGGGVLFGKTTLATQNYTVSVGNGGARPGTSASRGGSGQNSSAFSFTATGGGGGGHGGVFTANSAGAAGGSGGGSGRSDAVGGAGTEGPPRQGFAGGRGFSTAGTSGGGGGGANDFGKTAQTFNGVSTSGNGGDGIAWPATPTEFYGGGGAGATNIMTPGVGGIGGGGAQDVDGEDGRGGGGGGASGTGTTSGTGGSGIVIVRYRIAGIPPTKPTPLFAVGGQVFDQEENGVTYRYHKFVGFGDHAFRLFSTPEPTLSVEYLVVAGGGGGGAARGGGGGAGGALAGTETLAVGDFTASIGSGGIGARSAIVNTRGVSGTSSSMFSVTTVGGGGGGSGGTTGGNGGSGGGSARSNVSEGSGTAGPPRQGFDGARGRTTGTGEGGGGGGAGGAGTPGTATPIIKAGDGGVGIEWPAGSGEYYAGGGGGAGAVNGSGGLGGGGDGDSTGQQGEDGRGGGGGAGFTGSSTAPRGGTGGSGVVILRYILPPEGPTPPSVTTGTATEITKTSAKLSGSLDDDGGETATFGFAVGTAADNDTVFFISEPLGTELGTYELTVENLTAGTTYFFRAFALSGEGPGLGDWVEFTTEVGDPPTVFNAGVDFGGTFAEFAGLITDQGEGPVTGRGFVYSLTPNPVIGQEGTVNVPAGSGVGGFSARVTGLTPETTYHWRAYGTNVEAGTAYADSESFTTTEAAPPQTLTLTMPTVDEDTVPSVGTARFQTDPENTGTYTWEVAGEVEPPYFGGTLLNAVVDGVSAGQVFFPDGAFGETVAVQFTPAPNWFGELTFSYRVFNGFAFSDWEQATVTVNPVPDPPGPVIGEFPDFDEDDTATFDLTWTDVDDLPPGTLTAADGYAVQMRPTAGGAWRWLTDARPTLRLTNVTVRLLSYSDSELRGTFRVEPDANYYGPYGAQVRVAKQLEDESYLFGPVRNLAGTIAPVPDAPTRPQPNRMPTAKVGQTVSGRFTTFDPDIEDTSWLFEIAPAGTTEAPAVVYPAATGGDDVFDIEEDGKTYRVHVFDTVGTGTLTVTEGGSFEYLIVGGGGGGGGLFHGGGGGAGGFLDGEIELEAQTYSISVGNGGDGDTDGTKGKDGENSSAFDLVAVGGGGGGSNTSANGAGRAGGSGGGGGGNGSSQNVSGGAGTVSQGNDGGNGISTGTSANRQAGGGGGANEPGANAQAGVTSGKGGDGKVSNITGTAVVYAGGGGGGSAASTRTEGAGGAGGGGNGGRQNGPNPVAGTNGLGGGGGGGGNFGTNGAANGHGAPGGSGIVIVRYVIDDSTLETGGWSSSLVIPNVGTLTVVDDNPADQETLVQLVQEPGGATDLRYQFDLRVTDSSGLTSPVQRVTGLITLPTATVFLQKVTRNSPAVVTPLTPLVEVFDLNVTDSIDGIGGADVTVSTDEVRRRAAQLGITAAELLEPGTVELVVAIGTQLVFVGPVGEIEWSATADRINITARGLLSYLEERRIGTGTKSFVGEDIADIMWTLVDDAQGQAFGDYSFTDSTTTAGTNLTVEFEARTRILEALRSLARADGGPDFWIDPERRLNTATARGQDRRNIIRLTPGMMEGATWTNRDEQIATVVTVIGGEDGMGGFFQGTAVTTDTAALAKYGRREKLLEVPELTTNQQCEDYAARVVEEQARRSETIRLDIVVTPDRPFSIRDLEVGDILTVDLRAPDLGQVIGAYRVVNRRLNLVSETADSYRVRLDLVPAPFINSALVKVKARHNASIVERLAQLNSQQE